MPAIITDPAVNFPFNAWDLTAEIQEIPVQWGAINQSGLFVPEPGDTTLVAISKSSTDTLILGAAERGTTGPNGKPDTQDAVILQIPYLPFMESMKAADLQNKIVFGSGGQRLNKRDVEVAKRLEKIRRSHALTAEYMKAGALQGKIVDGNGDTLYDLFQVFGVTQKSIDFVLGTEGTDIQAKCDELADHIEDSIGGDTFDGITCYVTRQFFQKLTTHPKVEKYYIQHQGATGLQAARERGKFPFGSINFEVYRATGKNLLGQTKSFLPAGEGTAFPTGTADAFATYMAPPDHIDLVNTEGVELFVSPKVLDHGKGIDLHSESNILPVCRRPKVLVRCHSSN